MTVYTNTTQDFYLYRASYFDTNDVLRFKEIIEELKDLLLLEVLQTKITNLDNN
jgi:hypothetical protein